MSDTDYSSTAYIIEKAVLMPYMSPNGDVGNTPSNRNPEDITALITSVRFEQGLNSVSFVGQIAVTDRANLLESVPLRGEETLELDIQTNDTGKKISLKLFVYNITDVMFSGQMSGTSYVLHVVSQATFNASKRRVTEAYETNIADAVKSIFNKYFAGTKDGNSEGLPYKTKRFDIPTEPGRSLWVQGTEGIVDFIIPSLLPTEAMQFVSKRSYNPNTPSQTFRFFENWNGFYFVTDEYFFRTNRENVLNLFYSIETEQGNNPELDTKRIDNLVVLSRGSDTAGHIFSGAYRSRVMEIDLVRGIITQNRYNYIKDANFVDSDGQKVTRASSTHSDAFINDTFTEENEIDFLLFKDYASVGDIPGSLRGEQFFATIAQNRIAYTTHLNDTALSITTKGRADIMPGQIVDINIQSQSLESGGELNPQLNGRYLVSQTIHDFNEGILTTTAKVLKLGWSGTAIENNVENAEATP
jgi:hypothetical protein